jgi:SAM-dependent methyltransferase
VFYPLHARVCMHCLYVGLPEYVSAKETFTEYAYFSRTSTSWVNYVERSVAGMVESYSLDQSSQVVEMASNDGYLLQFFVGRGIPSLGVEPAANVAKAANESGVPTLAEFFNLKTATALRAGGKQADLLLAFNCLDHVPDLNDVISGMRVLLKPHGVIHVELPYLRSLIEDNEFDTIYHDRYSYFSFHGLYNAFERNGLRVFDVERIPTHGGSLRVRVCHPGNAKCPSLLSVAGMLAEEEICGLTTPEYYTSFWRQVARTKQELLACLVNLKRAGHSIVGYGVPAKGNVLLNYCGIRGDFLDYLVDRSPYKCGKYSPGTRLPIREVSAISETRPSHILILPWNIKNEIVAQMAFVREWGAQFVVAIPRIEVLSPDRALAHVS